MEIQKGGLRGLVPGLGQLSQSLRSGKFWLCCHRQDTFLSFLNVNDQLPEGPVKTQEDTCGPQPRQGDNLTGLLCICLETSASGVPGWPAGVIN